MTTQRTPTPATRACAAIADDLKAYADRELPLLRRLRVRRHITHCSDCQKELATMETITRDLKTENPAPPALAESLRTRLLAAAPDTPPAKRMRQSVPLWRRRPLATASVALASLTGVLLFGQMYGETMRSMSGGDSTGSAMMMYAQDYESAPYPSSRGVTEVTRAGAAAPGAPVSADMAGRSDAMEVGAMAAAPASKPAPPTRLMVAQNARQSRSPYTTFRGRGFPGFAKAEAEAANSKLYAGVSAYMDRKVNRDAQLGVSVERGQIEAKSEQVEDMVKVAGGYIASNNLLTEGGYRTASIVAKVPEPQFENMMRKMAGLGKVNSKSVSAEDITEQTGDATTAEEIIKNDVIALEAKLKNRNTERREERREYELRQARIQLAQMRNRLGALRKMAALSTITVSLSEKPIEVPKPPEEKAGFWSGMGETNRAATAAFQTALRVPLVMLMYTLAFSPIWVPLLIWWRVTEMRRRKMEMLALANSATASPDVAEVSDALRAGDTASR